MNLIPAFSDSVLRALGWTLAHSVWQICCFVLVLLLILPKVQAARYRYLLSWGSMLLIFATACATFGLVYEPDAPAQFLQITATFDPSAPTAQALLTYDPVYENPSVYDFTDWLERNHTYIVGCWMLGFVLFLLRLTGGFIVAQKLIKNQTVDVPDEWKARISRLLEKSGTRRSVQFLESALVHTPMVVGYFKPVVLFPIGIINQLPVNEVEAILAHELAHIIRRDWLVNLVQSFIEAIFYFHPGIWWISRQIRIEREHCCDDFAIEMVGNRIVYAKALLHAQELAQQRTPTPSLALALDGSGLAKPFWKKRPLFLERVKRILNQSPSKSSIMEKITATGLLLTIIAFCGFQAQSAPINLEKISKIVESPALWLGITEPEENQANYQISVSTDSIPGGKKIVKRISTDDGKQKMDITLENDQLTALKVDGKEIPAADFGKYKDKTDKLIAETSEMRELPELPELAELPELPEMAEMAELPELPEMAEGPEIIEIHGMGDAHFMQAPTQIRTDKDDKGNTVIHLEQNGKPTEIIVKDGVVYIDGKKMENGESLSIDNGGMGEGMAFSWSEDNGDEGADNGDEGAPRPKRMVMKKEVEVTVDNPGSEERKIIVIDRNNPKEMEKMHKEMEGKQMEMRIIEKRIMMDHEKDMKKHDEDMKKHDMDMKRHEKDMKKMEKDMKVREIEIRKEMEVRRDKQDMLGQAIGEQLVKDKIVEKADNYSIELSGKKMEVNGKKQSDEMRQKYLELYESKTGKKLGDKDTIVIRQEN